MKKFVVGAVVLLVLTAAVSLAVAAGVYDDVEGSTKLLDASEKIGTCIGSLDAACSQVQYEIMLANAGDAINPVTVTDQLPEGVEYLAGSATGGLIYEPKTRNLKWLGSLRANSVVTMSFHVRSTLSKSTPVTNTATICVGLTDSDCITRSATLMLDPVTTRPTPSPVATVTPTWTMEPTATSTPEWTPTATKEPGVTETPEMTPTVTATDVPPTETPSPTATVPTPTATATATVLTSRQFLPLILHVYPLPPAPTPTPTPSWPISLDSIWLESPRGEQNYEFGRCDVLYEWIQLTNHSDESVLISLDWRVRDWAGRYVPALSFVNWQLWWPSGSYQANLPRAIPTNLGSGPYELTVTLWNEQGLVAERVLYFTISEENVSTTPLAELQTCQGIGGDGLPIGVTDRFSVDAPAVYGWGWWQRGENLPHRVRWVWSAPDGEVYSDYEEEYVEECTYYAWAWLEIAGTEVADMPGEWQLDVYYDDVLTATRTFEITDEGLNEGNSGSATTGGGHLAGACGASDCRPLPPR